MAAQISIRYGKRLSRPEFQRVSSYSFSSSDRVFLASDFPKHVAGQIKCPCGANDWSETNEPNRYLCNECGVTVTVEPVNG